MDEHMHLYIYLSVSISIYRYLFSYIICLITGAEVVLDNELPPGKA